MMDGAHPNELDLLAYVEEDLPDARKEPVGEHLAGCAACAESVRQLETARYVLRSAPALELPAERRDAIVAGLPARAPRRRLAWRPRIVAPALAAAAVAAGVAAVVVTVDWDGGQEEAGQFAEAERAGEAAPAQTTEADGEDRTTLASAVRSVEGPPREVARFLRNQGFQARVVDSTVEVRNADADAVEHALAGRPDGRVTVAVAP